MSKGPQLTLALDAMGSDSAPLPEVGGALLAARQYGIRVLLVGQEPVVRAELARHGGAGRAHPGRVEIVPAEEVIRMDEKAIRAARTKRHSSIHVACRLVRDGEAAGMVSAGNTGAVMATGKMMLGSLPVVQRPALAAVFPTAAGSAAVMLDVGANVDCRPEHLEQFAIMGEIYHRVILASERPRVGLLSIGEEEIKGNDLTREAYALLRQLPIEFIGNVEGRDVYNGNVDVIVCDGFVGNVALKISEGLVETVRSLLKQSLESTLASKIGYVLSRQAYARFKKRLDYSEYGGAPLLGVRGVVIISHGRSNANAIKNALRVAREFHERRINQQIEAEITRRANLETEVSQPEA
ncbi:MAG TPA: phosphate acyltransferase PlsX [Terriglobales bacterium]|nr:phosphate acyltransferase PlsX [Terriglobales bacterium]